MTINILDKIAQLQRSDKKAALCIVVANKGSTPRKLGAKMIVLENGDIHGTIGGGQLEKKVIEDALVQIRINEAKLYQHNLLESHNMCCGGTMDIYIEPIMKIDQLYIFGAGHTGMALSKLANQLTFDITLIDDRKEAVKNVFDEDIKILTGSYTEQFKHLTFNTNTYIVILTYDHSFDRAILSYCLHQPFAYLGMIGSQRKIKLTTKMFIESGMATNDDLQKVDMPIGMDINAITPQEIAISILANIIKVKNSKKSF